MSRLITRNTRAAACLLGAALMSSAATMRPLRDAHITQSCVADAFEGEAQQDSQWLAEAARMREEFAAQIAPGNQDGTG